MDGREGLPLDLTLFDAFRDVCARLAEAIDLAIEANDVLEEALAAPLDRGGLGLASPEGDLK